MLIWPWGGGGSGTTVPVPVPSNKAEPVEREIELLAEEQAPVMAGLRMSSLRMTLISRTFRGAREREKK